MAHRDYIPRMIDGQMCKWYQAYGWAPAKLGQDLKIGDDLVFNYGCIETIVRVLKETNKTRLFELKAKSGELYQKRIGRATYWGVV